MMDDVAAKLKMDPVEFILKNMTRKAERRRALHFVLARRVHPRGAEAFEWKKRWRPRRDPTPARSSAAPACRS
jgi:CO/xanthine dehydrogenase Mo-binding subunit